MKNNENKSIIIAYKYAKEGRIAFSSEWMDVTNEDFKQIKKDCSRYVVKREKVEMFALNPLSSGGFTVADCFKNIDSTLIASFGDYDKSKKAIAKSIIGYSSEKFIKQLKNFGITYNEIQSFLAIINFIKENQCNCLDLLLANSDLINQFYDFAAYSKNRFRYGNYESVINKLEETYVFENQELQKGLSSCKYKTK